MKVRTDYVSNSSSSSFIVFGNMVNNVESKRIIKRGRTSIELDASHVFDVNDFDTLGKKEAFFIILKNAGSEGDYIIQLTPDLLNDCDLHQIDLSKFLIVKGRYVLTEGGTIYNACRFEEVRNDSSSLWDDGETDELIDKFRDSGIPLDGLHMLKYSLDYGSPKPKDRIEILNQLESYAKYN